MFYIVVNLNIFKSYTLTMLSWIFYILLILYLYHNYKSYYIKFLPIYNKIPDHFYIPNKL